MIGANRETRYCAVFLWGSSLEWSKQAASWRCVFFCLFFDSSSLRHSPAPCFSLSCRSFWPQPCSSTWEPLNPPPPSPQQVWRQRLCCSWPSWCWAGAGVRVSWAWWEDWCSLLWVTAAWCGRSISCTVCAFLCAHWRLDPVIFLHLFYFSYWMATMGIFGGLHCAGANVCLPFRNGCVRSGSPALFTHVPHQPLRTLLLFILEPFPVSDPAGGGGKLLHVPLSIPKEGPKSWHPGSGCGGLRHPNHTNGGTGHQNTPYAHTVGEFLLHVIWHVAGVAGFQRDVTNEAWQYCCHGDILPGTAADSSGRYQSHRDEGWLLKMEEALNGINDDLMSRGIPLTC